jgi:hypothetical protein
MNAIAKTSLFFSIVPCLLLSRTKTPPEEQVLDFRYAPAWWQTCIGLPDDPQKTLVGREGQLLYNHSDPWVTGTPPGPFFYFNACIQAGVQEGGEWLGQKLASPKIPIVRTEKRCGRVRIVEQAFSAAPPMLNRVDSLMLHFYGEFHKKPTWGPPRNDLLSIEYRNEGPDSASVTPVLTIQSTEPVSVHADDGILRAGPSLQVFSVQAWSSTNAREIAVTVRGEPRRGFECRVVFPRMTLGPNDAKSMAFGIGQGRHAPRIPENAGQMRLLLGRAEAYWRTLELPYHRITVPDTAIQNLLVSSIRNIFQAREIRDGLPAFQVGPTCYRGLWVVDGSFLLDAMQMLGSPDARRGIEYLLSFQRPDGSIMLIDGHWKETGILLWALVRQARLSGDKAWLGFIWPKVEAAFVAIERMRLEASPDPQAPNAGLLPAGFCDGGLAGPFLEYTNVVWSLAGMKAAVEAAFWLGKSGEANAWMRFYEDFYGTFRHAAKRDMKKDAAGNPYLPVLMTDNRALLPQKAQWAFLHAVFPGRVFVPGDPLVEGNLAMLKSAECEGLVIDTGWLDNGIWNYFGSFYGHALLWTGRGREAASKLYAMANHAAPTLVWREEQSVRGAEPFEVVGDMPHNWASAEMIRLVRHLIVLERGSALHLFEGLPQAWTKPGMRTKLEGVATEFGPITLELNVAQDGKTADLSCDLDSSRHDPPSRVKLHFEGLTGKKRTTDLPNRFPIRQRIRLKK